MMRANRAVWRFRLVLSMLLSALSAGAGRAADAPIRIGVGLDPAFAPFYYAAQQKLFAKNGVNVELLTLGSAADAADGIIAGTNELAGGSETTMITRAARGDLKIIAVYTQSTQFVKLVVRKGIADPKELTKIGIVPGSASQFATAKLLTRFAIDEKSVTLVRAAPPEIPALLVRGDIDGYFLWEPWPARGVQAGGKVLMTSGDVGYTATTVLAVSGAWLAGHAAQAHAIVAALRQTCNDFRADPDRAATATQAVAKIPAAQAKELLNDIECSVHDFTPANIATYNEIADLLFATKATAKRVDIARFTVTGYAN